MTNGNADDLRHPTGERRKHRRHFVDLPIDCCAVQQRGKGPIQAGVAENAGAGGFLIYLNQRFSPGSHLVIELYYKETYQFSSIKILGKVIWSDEQRDTSGYRHGVKLLKLENGGGRKLQYILGNFPSLI
jgi:hypothetical protein